MSFFIVIFQIRDLNRIELIIELVLSFDIAILEEFQHAVFLFGTETFQALNVSPSQI